MAFEVISQDEADQLMSPQAQGPQAQGPQGGFEVITVEELERLMPKPPDQEPGLGMRMVERFLGTDVNDPLELERLGTTMAGAIGGSMAGFKHTPRLPGLAGVLVNPVTGAAAGGLAGAISGTVAPEGFLELGESLGILSPGAREDRGLSNEELRRVVEGEALIELSTMGLATSIRAAGRFIGKAATGVGRSEMAFAREASEAGIDLAPFQLGTRGLGRGIVNVVGRFPFLGSKARSVSEAAEAAIKMKAEGVPARLAPIMASSDVSERLWDSAKGVFKAFDNRIDARYNEVFSRADELNVVYNMRAAKESTKGVLARVLKRRPLVAKEITLPDGSKTTKMVVKGPSKAAKIVAKFLQKEGYAELGHQSLRQADELILKIDDFVAAAGNKKLRGRINELLSPVRGALKADIAINGLGDNAKMIGRELADVDADFSGTLAQLFETSAALGLETVQSGGLRSTLAPSARTTRVPVDKLARHLVDMDSPQVMAEIARVVDQPTYRKIASMELSKLFDSAMTETGGVTRINDRTLKKNFGIGHGSDAQTRFGAISTMLQHSGSDLTTEELGTIVKAAGKLAETPVPNWSTFVARRATLGGAASLMRGVFPFAALTGSAGAAGAAGGVGALGSLAFFLGSRGLVSAVANPNNARAFKTILRKEAKGIAKRAAYLRLMRATIQGMHEAGELTRGVADTVWSDVQGTVHLMFPEEEKK